MAAAWVRSLLKSSSRSAPPAAAADTRTSRSTFSARRLRLSARRRAPKRRPPRRATSRAGTPSVLSGPGGRWARRRRHRAGLGALVENLVLLHLAVQRRAVQPENLRGLLLVPVGAHQRLDDGHLLDLGQRALRRDRELLHRRHFVPDRLGQIPRLDVAGLAHEHRALDGVLELAHVAGPAVADQQMVGRRRDRPHAAAVALVELGEEMVAEQRHVFRALAQRRHLQRDRVDAEVEVLAQAAVAQRVLELDVRVADQAEVHPDQPIAADRAVLALLQHTKELRLQVGRHLANLVEEQRPALGHLEEPHLVAGGARERAFAVPEQLALDELGGNGRAVDLDERPAHTVGVVVDGVGNQLFAGTVLALNQDVRVARRHTLDELEEVLHLLALPHHVPEAVPSANLFLESQVLGPLAGELHGLVEDVDESGLVHGLFEKIERSRLTGLHGARHAALGTDHDDLRRLVGLFQPPEERYPIRVRQLEVGQHHVGAPLAENLLAAGANQRRPHLIAFGLDDDAKPLRHRWFVVDHEYAPPAFRSDRRHGRHFLSVPPTPNLPCDVLKRYRFGPPELQQDSVYWIKSDELDWSPCPIIRH